MRSKSMGSDSIIVSWTCWRKQGSDPASSLTELAFLLTPCQAMQLFRPLPDLIESVAPWFCVSSVNVLQNPEIRQTSERASACCVPLCVLCTTLDYNKSFIKFFLSIKLPVWRLKFFIARDSKQPQRHLKQKLTLSWTTSRLLNSFNFCNICELSQNWIDNNGIQRQKENGKLTDTCSLTPQIPRCCFVQGVNK